MLSGRLGPCSRVICDIICKSSVFCTFDLATERCRPRRRTPRKKKLGHIFMHCRTCRAFLARQCTSLNHDFVQKPSYRPSRLFGPASESEHRQLGSYLPMEALRLALLPSSGRISPLARTARNFATQERVGSERAFMMPGTSSVTSDPARRFHCRNSKSCTSTGFRLDCLVPNWLVLGSLCCAQGS